MVRFRFCHHFMLVCPSPMRFFHPPTHSFVHPSNTLTGVADAVGVEEERGAGRQLELGPTGLALRRGVELVATVVSG